ncbi:glycosyltransferase family 4 protein [Rhizorhabdus dicambivorans]|uniref:Glycosyltransferase family 1 protein n=1 Tax=Rhizorhabdus dicambivorans TaxID=1850238 RepID=A0A2A4FUE2_9SPHN|nr:glycosyltransferase family 1 protein [Rhizorhabdus dicambivorans]ATE64756.1 glycosyltransferase family 1 protein [Rhizorhabdus dicambivorans]PCE41302.1 glycosyltransferase family 1 protein [Rhizorhabdus dicambivorans]
MDASQLRVALFTGNYNYVRDGANQALNRLVGYLLRQGAAVRVYSPTIEKPAFAPTGDLVSVPSLPVPGRAEYRFPTGIPARVRRDLTRFDPNILHVASPEILGHRAVSLALRRKLPVVASVHTRFETYFRYYGLAFMEPLVEALLRRFYRRCDAIFAPSESMAQLLREQRMSYDVGIWSRGIDRTIFQPERRSLEWRRSLGIADDEVAIGFVGRLVMEKGLDVFADAIDQLERRQVRHKVLVVGQGPAREWFEKRLPQAVFAGFQAGEDLGRAVASMDMLFNPSVTETFGNVTLEAMAAGLPVVAARATGSESLIEDGVTGRLIAPGRIIAFADALQAFCDSEELRRTIGQAGLRASERYGWDQVNQELVDSYMRIIRQHQAGIRVIRQSPVP